MGEMAGNIGVGMGEMAGWIGGIASCGMGEGMRGEIAGCIIGVRMGGEDEDEMALVWIIVVAKASVKVTWWWVIRCLSLKDYTCY